MPILTTFCPSEVLTLIKGFVSVIRLLIGFTNNQQQTRDQSLNKKSDSEEMKQRQLSGPHLVSAQHYICDKKKSSGHWSQSPVKTGCFINHC